MVISLKTISILSLFMFEFLVNSLPLSTNGRWVVDSATGNRIKLRCVNLPSHLDPMVVEGLDKQPLAKIIDSMSSLGFNCVRLTWAVRMFTNISNNFLTVDRSFESLGLNGARKGIGKNNPSFLNFTLLEAYDSVVDELSKKGIMVVLDNHVSKPQWCCSENDGNGFFGDKYFDPMEWLEGLRIVASRYMHKPQVVGMSIRNELRGSRQNVEDWYRYVCRGAALVHEMNPNVLIIVSGLSYDSNLSFLKARPLGVNLGNKLVYEAHWYATTNGRKKHWKEKPSQICETTMREFDNKAWFLTMGNNPIPLFLSEFGVDQRGVSLADNNFLSCFLAYAAERDVDWALWDLPGSYYIRTRVVDMEETYGVLDKNWNRTRSPNFKERYKMIQEMLQDPRSRVSTYQILYHPLTGRCVLVDEKNNIQLTDCQKRSHWSYNGNGTQIKLMGSSKCLKVIKIGLSVGLSTDCSSNQSIWKMVSSPKLILAAKDEQGRSLCLVNSSNSSAILTKECMCLTDGQCQENPETQWFKLIPSNIK